MLKTLLHLIILISGVSLCMAADNAESISNAADDSLPNFDALWDYNDPAATRAKFEELLPLAEKSGDKSYHLQLQTQIARTMGLQQMFDSAHQVLDQVEARIDDKLMLVRVRYLLERGRTFNSSGFRDKALALFLEAYEMGQGIGADFYAIDAAHMVAIAAEDRDERMSWNLKGLQIAENSSDQRARKRQGSIYNNVGWDYHDAGEYEKALDMFEKALAFRRESGKAGPIRIARWCVARAYRSLGRFDEALGIQQDLEKDFEKEGGQDGFVWE